MKCPEGTVEVAIWSDGIFFDARHKNQNDDWILGIVSNHDSRHNDRRFNLAVLERLKPVMDLGHNWEPNPGTKVWLFEPDVFELLTEGIEYEMP